MSQPIDDLIDRLLNLFGPPQCDAPETYIEEVRASLRGYAADLILVAGDTARDECKFFPRPAELREFIQRELSRRSIGKPRDSFEHLDAIPAPSPETVARVRELVEKAKLHMTGRGTAVDAFADLRPTLTAASRRMTGELE